MDGAKNRNVTRLQHNNNTHASTQSNHHRSVKNHTLQISCILSSLTY